MARLFEGGNLAVGDHHADHIDLSKLPRKDIAKEIKNVLIALNILFTKQYKTPIWTVDVMRSGEFFSGSSLHFFNVSEIEDAAFVEKKPTVGDVDTMVPKECEGNLAELFISMKDKTVGNAVFRGYNRGNEQFSALFELPMYKVNIQVDFEFVEFSNGIPTEWSKFSHSSSWDDIQQGVKGVFHKWLIQSITALGTQDFYLRKMTGRGKLRTEVDVPVSDSVLSFAVSSKEGGGLRKKYVPVIGPDGNPEQKDGKPVMRTAPAEGYIRDLSSIFQMLLGPKINPKYYDEVKSKFWSFTGLLQVLSKVLNSKEKQLVAKKFLEKAIGPGAQGMYRNDPEKDIKEKTKAINVFYQTMNIPVPSALQSMMDTYRQGYKMTESVDFGRKGIKHLYNPNSKTELGVLDFISLCEEIVEAADSPVFKVNLKVDGAGVRVGKNNSGELFFMTSRMTSPKFLKDVGVFSEYATATEQPEDRIEFAKKYDDAMQTILSSSCFSNIPKNTVVFCEMLLNSLAVDDGETLTFVNIPYEKKYLGKKMTLVPYAVKSFQTGEELAGSSKIIEGIKTDGDVMIRHNRLPNISIPVLPEVKKVVELKDKLVQSIRSKELEKKAAALSLVNGVRSLLSERILKIDIPGKNSFGSEIEGIILQSPSGVVVKITSDMMRLKVAGKRAATNKIEKSSRHKTAVVTFGSFVGHVGHEQLIDQVITIAKNENADVFVYVSPVVGPKDPVQVNLKLKTLRMIFPEIANSIQTWHSGGSALKKIEKELVLPKDSPYNKIVVVVGSDRYEGVKSMMAHLESRMKDPIALEKYGGTQNEVEFVTVKTEREASAGGTGVSFTLLRNTLGDPTLTDEQKNKIWRESFSKSVTDTVLEQIMDQTKLGMGITSAASTASSLKTEVSNMSPELKRRLSESLTKLMKLVK